MYAIPQCSVSYAFAIFLNCVHGKGYRTVVAQRCTSHENVNLIQRHEYMCQIFLIYLQTFKKSSYGQCPEQVHKRKVEENNDQAKISTLESGGDLPIRYLYKDNISLADIAVIFLHVTTQLHGLNYENVYEMCK